MVSFSLYSSTLFAAYICFNTSDDFVVAVLNAASQTLTEYFRDSLWVFLQLQQILHSVSRILPL